MSIRNYNKVLNVKDMTTGSIVNVISLDLDTMVNLSIPLNELLMLTSVKELLQDEHNVLLTTGYKSE